MRFKRVVALHAQPLIGTQQQKLVYEVLQVGVVQGFGPVKLAAEDFVEDNHLGAAEERSFAAGHLVQDDAKGPEVRKGARLGLVEHLGGHVKRRAHKGIRSFCFLDVL